MDDESQPMVLANINLAMAPNGKDALCAFTFLGTMAINLVIPEGVVNEFVQQWSEARRNTVQIARLKRLPA